MPKLQTPIPVIPRRVRRHPLSSSLPPQPEPRAAVIAARSIPASQDSQIATRGA